MDEWANRLLADVSNWRPKDMGIPGGIRTVPDKACLEAIDVPALPDGWRPTTTTHDGFALEFGEPEALRYNPGAGMVYHHDRHRPATDRDLVHVGTLIVARYDPHTDGGELHIRRDTVDWTTKTYDADVDTVAMAPGPGWREALILRGQGHHVTDIVAGGRFVLKLPAYVRRRPRDPESYGKWYPPWPKHVVVLRDADLQAGMMAKSAEANPEDVRKVWHAVYNEGIRTQRLGYFYCD